MSEFWSWQTLATYAGATAATMLVTQFVKGLADKFFNVPTNLIAYGVALVVLILAQQFTGTLDASTAALSAFNAILVATAASGSYDAASRMKDGFVWKKENV